MAILRSPTVSGSPRALHNAAVDRALLDWEERVNQARDEGIALGLQQAAEQVREAKAIQAGVDEKITSIQQAADLKIKQKNDFWKEEWGRVLASLQEALDEVASLEKQAVQSSERAILQLALQMAGHMLNRQIVCEEEWMLPLLQQAIQQLPDKRAIQIRMHPLDAEHVQENRRAVTELIQQSITFDVLADEQISRGSLILESQGTHIDSGLPRTWERLCAYMLETAPDADWSTSAVAGPAKAGQQMPAVSPDADADVQAAEQSSTESAEDATQMPTDPAQDADGEGADVES